MQIQNPKTFSIPQIKIKTPKLNQNNDAFSIGKQMKNITIISKTKNPKPKWQGQVTWLGLVGDKKKPVLH